MSYSDTWNKRKWLTNALKSQVKGTTSIILRAFSIFQESLLKNKFLSIFCICVIPCMRVDHVYICGGQTFMTLYLLSLPGWAVQSVSSKDPFATGWLVCAPHGCGYFWVCQVSDSSPPACTASVWPTVWAPWVTASVPDTSSMPPSFLFCRCHPPHVWQFLGVLYRNKCLAMEEQF